MKNFVQYAIENGGIIRPLIVDSQFTNGTGLFNPSILVDGNKIYVNIRHCQYTLYHAELSKHEHPYGPLIYFNPENDISLTTTNFFGELNDDLSLKWISRVDTSKLDVKPLWEFIGLEDVRLIKWDNKIHMCGVRRDTTPNGQGRMELSEIVIENETVREVSRFRIPAPGPDNSYCEKNWMPIIDQQFHFLKWCNPVEIVTVDPVKKTSETKFVHDLLYFEKDQRGGGQVISWKEGYLSLTHETDLWFNEMGRKNATYRHRFVYWDKNWKPQKISPVFSFMGAKIEFACGLAKKDENIYITFGYQDNAAYIIKIDENTVERFIND